MEDGLTRSYRVQLAVRTVVGVLALSSLLSPGSAEGQRSLLLAFVGLTSLTLLGGFISRLFRIRSIEYRRQVERRNLGVPRALRSQAAGSFVTALVFAAAARFADLAVLWAVLSALFLATSAFAIAYSRVAQKHPDKTPGMAPLTDEVLDRHVFYSRLAQPLVAAILAAWLYAWRWLAA